MNRGPGSQQPSRIAALTTDQVIQTDNDHSVFAEVEANHGQPPLAGRGGDVAQVERADPFDRERIALRGAE